MKFFVIEAKDFLHSDLNILSPQRSTRSTRPRIPAENLGPIQDIIDQILEKFNGTIDVPKTCLIWDEIWSPGLPFSISSPKQMCFAGPVLDIIALLVFGFKGFRIGFYNQV